MDARLVYAWFEVADTTLLLVTAVTVFLVAPSRRQNRILALVLLVDAGAHAASGIGSASVATGFGPATLFASGRLFAVTVFSLPFLYLLFLGTIDVRSAAPLRHKVGVFILGGLAVAAAAAPLVFRDAFVPPGDGDSTPLTMAAAFVLVGLVSLLGLVLALVAWRNAEPGTPARRRAGIFAVAFGARDLFFTMFMVAFVLRDRIPLFRATEGWFPVVADLVFVPLLAYGILRFQLLDIDLRLKWTIRRGTVAAAFAAVFFVVAQLIQNVASTTLGVIGGAAAAGLLLFAIQPLQRAAERVAHAAMPHVQETPQYLAARRAEVYRAAVESAQEEGGIDTKERAILDRLQAKLGLSRQDATRVEAAVFGA